MQALSKYNDGFKYSLTVICIFLKKAYASELKTENCGKSICHCVDSSVPEKVQTDAGKEFWNKTFRPLWRNTTFFSKLLTLSQAVT